MSVASVAQLLQQQGGGGGGGNVNDIIAGNGIIVNDNGFGDYTVENNGVVYGINGAGIGLNLAQDGGLTVTNTGVVSLTAGAGIALDATTGDITITNTGGGGGGVTSIIAGNGINVDANTGDVTVTSVVNPADYLTTANAALTYQPIGNYLSATYVSKLVTYTFDATNVNIFPITILTQSLYSHTISINSLPYNVNNIFLVTLMSVNNTFGGIFDRYVQTSIIPGVPNNGTYFEIFISNPFPSTIEINQIFVLVVTPT